MKSTELRIGNYVKSLGIVYVVWKIDAVGNIQGLEGGTTFNLDNTAEPIPLTEEILLKCGFEWEELLSGYFDKLHAVYLWENGDIVFHPFCTNDKDCQISIKHLHQLQNLYFVLTGEELNIEL